MRNFSRRAVRRVLPDYAYWRIRYDAVQSLTSRFWPCRPRAVHFCGSGPEPDFVGRLRRVCTNRPTPLCRAMTRHGSDKGTGVHHYTTIYAALFAPIRRHPIRLFELGIGTNDPTVRSNMGAGGRPGASLRGWREFFTSASIYGADVDRSVLFSEDRIRTFWCDQLDPAAIRALWASPDLAPGVDILVEDAVHTFEASMSFMDASIPHVRPGGYYVIEDVHASDVDRWQDELRAGYGRTLPDFDFCVVVLPDSPIAPDNNLVMGRRRPPVTDPSAAATARLPGTSR